jgi:hypothetical protein
VPALVRMELVIALVMPRPASVVPAVNVFVAKGSARILRRAVVAPRVSALRLLPQVEPARVVRVAGARVVANATRVDPAFVVLKSNSSSTFLFQQVFVFV